MGKYKTFSFTEIQDVLVSVTPAKPKRERHRRDSSHNGRGSNSHNSSRSSGGYTPNHEHRYTSHGGHNHSPADQYAPRPPRRSDDGASYRLGQNSSTPLQQYPRGSKE